MDRTFGPNLRQARLVAGFTQTELASLMDVSQTTISAWEAGETEPSIAKLRRLARALDVTVSYLIGDDSGGVAA